MAAKKGRPAAAGPAPAKTTTKTAASKTPASKSTAKGLSFSGSARAEISPDEVRKLISEAAYYRAKQRGFTPGHEEEDWIQAEAEVMRRLNGPGRPA
jgi:hypothetical protein